MVRRACARSVRALHGPHPRCTPAAGALAGNAVLHRMALAGTPGTDHPAVATTTTVEESKGGDTGLVSSSVVLLPTACSRHNSRARCAAREKARSSASGMSGDTWCLAFAGPMRSQVASLAARWGRVRHLPQPALRMAHHAHSLLGGGCD